MVDSVIFNEQDLQLFLNVIKPMLSRNLGRKILGQLNRIINNQLNHFFLEDNEVGVLKSLIGKGGEFSRKEEESGFLSKVLKLNNKKEKASVLEKKVEIANVSVNYTDTQNNNITQEYRCKIQNLIDCKLKIIKLAKNSMEVLQQQKKIIESYSFSRTLSEVVKLPMIYYLQYLLGKNRIDDQSFKFLFDTLYCVVSLGNLISLPFLPCVIADYYTSCKLKRVLYAKIDEVNKDIKNLESEISTLKNLLRKCNDYSYLEHIKNFQEKFPKLYDELFFKLASNSTIILKDFSVDNCTSGIHR